MKVNRLAWIQTFAQTQSLLQLDVSKKFTIARKYPNSNFLHFFRRFFTEQDDKHKNKLLLMMNPLFCVFFFFFVTYDEEKSISFRFNWLFCGANVVCFEGRNISLTMSSGVSNSNTYEDRISKRNSSAGLTLGKRTLCGSHFKKHKALRMCAKIWI